MSGYISVLLQKSTAAGGWGFLLGSEPPSPNVIVTQVDTECVASQLLEPGDRVLELEGFEANRLTQRQMDGILTGPSNKLSMVLLKRRRGDIGPLYSTREIRKEDFSSREEQRSRYEQRGDYNYYELSSQTERSEKSQEKTKDEEKQDKGMEGVYEAKPFVNHTPSQQDSSMKTDELRSQHTHEKKSSRIEESQSSAQKITEEITSSSKVKKEVSEMEEKKKSSSSFWTEPPKDLRSAVRNSKFWKSPGGHFVSTSTIFNQLNNLHNEQKRTNPREEKRQFWENCNRGKFGRDSPGSKSDGASGEKREEDLRSRSCEPEHLKPNNPFNSYETYKTTSPNNPFYSQSPTNPFCEEYKESYLEETVDGCMVSSETKYTSSSSQEEPKTTASVPTASTDIATEVKTEEKRQVSDFNTNREFFERATSVPTVSCVKNAQDLVSERMSPSGFSGLKKPSDFINQIRAENQRSQSLQPENKRQEREKSVPRALPKDYRPSGPGNGFVRASSSDNDRRCFTETSYEKVTRVGTPYENVESAWRREYRVATPSGFYDNNFEEILKEDSFLRSPEKVPARNLGPEEAVEEAFRLLTMREGLEPVYGRYFGSTRQSNQIQTNGNGNNAPANGPPPPPPPPSAGNIPAVRIASEVGARKCYEPPAAIQNAMMTKDKKPFTYTPGGLDLSEIRSPRMARRISRNAHTQDSCTPLSQQAPSSPPGAQQPLPPAALAAMQPQIAIPVFPPGGGAPYSPPPPPPPPPTSCPPSSAPLPPPPPPLSPASAVPPRPEFLADIASHPPLRPVGQAPKSAYEQQPPEFLADIASHPPLRPVGQAPRSSYEPQPSQIQVQLKPVSPKASIDQPDQAGTAGQIAFVPRPHVEIPTQNAPANQGATPPIQNQMRTPQIQSVTPPVQQARAPMTPPVQSVRTPPTPPTQPAPPFTPSPQSVQSQRQPQTPSTPTLNKSPAPWLTNKTVGKEVQPPWAVRQQSAESPQSTPQIQPQNTQQPGYQPVTRVIPIQVESQEPATPPTQPKQFGQTQHKYVYPPSPQVLNQQPSPNFNQAQPQYVQPPLPQQQYVQPPPHQQQFAQPQPPQQQYVYPPQYVPPQFTQMAPQQQYLPVQPQLQEPAGRTRIIPIQIEGSSNNQQPSQKPIYQNQISQPGNGQSRNQNGDADPRKYQTQTSWSGNPIQSRSFKVLQKITGSDDEPQASVQQAPMGEVILVNRVNPAQATEPVSREYNGWGTNTPPVYPNYWYNPPQTPEEQQQFWDHYNAMCSYMAHMNATAMRYSPYPYPYPYPLYPSDTEDYSNSSSDEMAIYGKMFKEHSRQMQQQALNQNEQPVTPSDATPSDLTETEGEEDTSDSDTEVEEKPLNPITSIRSVPNINVYACNSDESSEESESSEEEEEEETEDESLPHQLSVIYEESDFSSEEGRKSNAKSPYESDNSSSSTLKNKDEDENAVKVRLPIQLKFTRSENDIEVATLIVGNSEMEASKTNETEDSSLIITDIIKEDSDPDVTATIILKKNKVKEVLKSRESSPVDFWKELNGESKISTVNDRKSSEDDSHWEDDSSSASVQTVKKGISGNDSTYGGDVCRLSEEKSMLKSFQANNTLENSETEESSEEEDEDDDVYDESREENKSHIEIIVKDEEETDEDVEDEDSESSSSSSSSEDESEHSNVFHDNSTQENNTTKKNELLSVKSFEESEDDSGVTSDLSRHISETDTDPECGSELSKMTRCQRVATHSRLFKLLQDECEAEDNAEETSESISQRKERLSLPLNNGTGDDSLSSSSGVNSPSSPIINDRLVKELIQSLLTRKKGRHFRKLPMEKLHAAALRILQEDMDPYDTVSTSDESNIFLSPASIHNKGSATTYTDSSLLNPETYGRNYYDYCNYYSTWGTAGNDEENDYDIMPSKTFKILQGQTQGEPMAVKVRCPRVPSSKNLREQLTTPIPSFPSPIPKDT